MKLQLTSASMEETMAFGRQIGRALGGGELLELVSDVGGGKTTFVKGLAEGLGVKQTVQSPTFTINRVYRCRDGLELHHFDFYRLQDPGIMVAELRESLDDPKVVVVIEWAGIVENILPLHHIKVDFVTTSDEGERLEFSIPQTDVSLRSVLANLQKGES